MCKLMYHLMVRKWHLFLSQNLGVSHKKISSLQMARKSVNLSWKNWGSVLFFQTFLFSRLDLYLCVGFSRKTDGWMDLFRPEVGVFFLDGEIVISLEPPLSLLKKSARLGWSFMALVPQVKGCMTDCGETDCKWGRPKKQRKEGRDMAFQTKRRRPQSAIQKNDGNIISQNPFKKFTLDFRPLNHFPKILRKNPWVFMAGATAKPRPRHFWYPVLGGPTASSVVVFWGGFFSP